MNRQKTPKYKIYCGKLISEIAGKYHFLKSTLRFFYLFFYRSYLYHYLNNDLKREEQTL